MSQQVQVTTNGEVHEMLRQFGGSRPRNKLVLGIDIRARQILDGGGYPKFMHHATFDSVQVWNEDQETAMLGQGFGFTYGFKSYPKFKFRRNMNPKFGPTDNKPWLEFIEERLIKDEPAERLLAKERKPHDHKVTAWVDKVADLEPLPEPDEQDPHERIAYLEGQLAQATTKVA